MALRYGTSTTAAGHGRRQERWRGYRWWCGLRSCPAACSPTSGGAATPFAPCTNRASAAVLLPPPASTARAKRRRTRWSCSACSAGSTRATTPRAGGSRSSACISASRSPYRRGSAAPLQRPAAVSAVAIVVWDLDIGAGFCLVLERAAWTNRRGADAHVLLTSSTAEGRRRSWPCALRERTRAQPSRARDRYSLNWNFQNKLEIVLQARSCCCSSCRLRSSLRVHWMDLQRNWPLVVTGIVVGFWSTLWCAAMMAAHRCPAWFSAWRVTPRSAAVRSASTPCFVPCWPSVLLCPRQAAHRASNRASGACRGGCVAGAAPLALVVDAAGGSCRADSAIAHGVAGAGGAASLALLQLAGNKSGARPWPRSRAAPPWVPSHGPCTRSTAYSSQLWRPRSFTRRTAKHGKIHSRLPQLQHSSGSGSDDSSSAPTESTIRLLRVDRNEEHESAACTVDLARFAAQTRCTPTPRSRCGLDSMMMPLAVARQQRHPMQAPATMTMISRRAGTVCKNPCVTFGPLCFRRAPT